MSNQSTIGSLSIIQSLGRAWENMKPNIWLFGGFTFVYFIVSSILGFMPVLGGATSLFGFIFSASIFSAFYIYDKKRNIEFNDFFSWSPKFGRLFVGNLLLIALVIAILIPFVFIIIAILGVGFFTTIASSPQEIEGLLVGSTIVVLLLSILLFVIVVSVALFAYPYIIQFTELSYGDALKYSFKIGRNNIGQVIVFAFVATGLAILGFLCLGIGLLFTIPLITGAQYYFLKDMIADEEPKEEQWDFMQQSPE